MEAGRPEQTPCVEALLAAIVAGAVDRARTAAEHCVAAGTDAALLEPALIAALQSADDLTTADALRSALTALQPLWRTADLEGAAGEPPATVLLATLPGDRHDVGRHLWRMLLQRRGFTVRDLAVRAPALVAGHAVAAASEATAIVGVYVFDVAARPALQSLVAHLLRRSQSDASFKAPLLVGGPGVDEAFAQWVAIPEGGTPYWGGVYYCEDGTEMLEVLRQIVLFEPPPVAHEHASSGDLPQDGCATCGGCPLVTECDLGVA
jgi:cobalamin-dependent methionine synthase I